MDVIGWQEGHPVPSQGLTVSDVVDVGYRPSLLRDRPENARCPTVFEPKPPGCFRWRPVAPHAQDMLRRGSPASTRRSRGASLALTSPAPANGLVVVIMPRQPHWCSASRGRSSSTAGGTETFLAHLNGGFAGGAAD